MLTLNAYIHKVDGVNGCLLVNTATSEVLDLGIEDAASLDKIMSQQVENSRLKEYLLKNGWGTETEETSKPEELCQFDLESRGLTEFSLNKVIIEVSGECGLDCCFCNADNYNAFASCTCKRWNYKEADIDYTNIVEQLISFRVQKVMIIGGDPFYNAFERLKSLLNILNEKGYTGEIVIMTNGQSLNKAKIEFISKFKNVRVNIIFMGSNEDEYRVITRKKKVFKTVIKNVKLLRKYDVCVNGTYLVNCFNISDIENSEINALGINIGVKHIFDEKYNTKALIFSHSSRMLKIDYQADKLLRETNCCLYSQVFIASNLEVYPCPYLRDFQLGNLQNEKLFEIFRTGKYREFWFLSKNKIESCSSCKYHTVCVDCRAIEYGITHDLYAEYFCDEVSKISSIKKICEGK